MADAMMNPLGEANGVKWYWAEPGQFDRPGVYYWDGNRNVLCVPYAAPTAQEASKPATLTPDALVVGDHYNWRGQTERLAYLCAKKYPGDSRTWFLFERIDDPGKVWCEVLGSDIPSFEASKPVRCPSCNGESAWNHELPCDTCHGSGFSPTQLTEAAAAIRQQATSDPAR